uniref:Uncharacterized protein n=1 Tax=Anguilla anguilla TaxID=7936 RepID=A0A0E9XSS6_ANGAN
MMFSLYTADSTNGTQNAVNPMGSLKKVYLMPFPSMPTQRSWGFPYYISPGAFWDTSLSSILLQRLT